MNLFLFAKLLLPFIFASKGGGSFVSALGVARTLSGEGDLSPLRSGELLRAGGGTGIKVDPDAVVQVIPTENSEHHTLESAINPEVSFVRKVTHLV